MLLNQILTFTCNSYSNNMQHLELNTYLGIFDCEREELMAFNLFPQFH